MLPFDKQKVKVSLVIQNWNNKTGIFRIHYYYEFSVRLGKFELTKDNK